MKKENYSVTQSIYSHYENVKELPDKIDEDASIWDLDDGYSFEWCEWPKEKERF